MFDFLIVGSGLYGAIFAYEAKKQGKSVLVVDKRPNVGGNIYTEKVEGINVHKYGAHIFIPIIRKYGIILHSLQNLTALRIVQLRIIRVNYIRFRLICIRLIKCGAL